MEGYMIEGAPLSREQAQALLQVLAVASVKGGMAAEVLKAQIALERIVAGVDEVSAVKGPEELAGMTPMPPANPNVAPEGGEA